MAGCLTQSQAAAIGALALPVPRKQCLLSSLRARQQEQAAAAGALALAVPRKQWLCFSCCRYSPSTIDALEMMDDDKVDLDLIAALIRHIVLEEEVQWDWAGSDFGWSH